MKHYPAAIGEYQKAIELDPKLHLAYNDLGFTLLQLQKFGSARLAYEQTVELRLQWALARGGLGTTFMRTDGTYKVARGWFARSSVLRRKFPNATRRQSSDPGSAVLLKHATSHGFEPQSH